MISGGKIAAVGADVAAPPGATVIDGAGRTVYPGLIDGLTTLGLTEIGSVSGSVDVAEIGDVNPHAQAWVAVNPHSDLLPWRAPTGSPPRWPRPTGGLISGQSALIRLAGSTPDALTVKTPVAMHVVYPTGRPPFDLAADVRGAGARRPSRSGRRTRRRTSEKELRRLGQPPGGGQGLRRGARRRRAPRQARPSAGGAGARGPRRASRWSSAPTPRTTSAGPSPSPASAA